MMSSSKDTLSYSLGVLIGKNLQQQGFADDLSIEMFAQAVKDVVNENDLQITAQEANAVLQEYSVKQQAQQAEKEAVQGEENLKAGEAFLAENANRPEVKTTESGLQYEVLKSGDGPSPAATDKVKVHYHGTLIDGTVFDSSVDRGQPASFPVNGVIPGWVEALQLMSVGDKWKLYIPSGLAYGPRSAGPTIGPNSTLIFEVELLEIL